MLWLYRLAFVPALLVLARTTGMTPFVLGVENELSAERAEPARGFDLRWAQQAWWCPALPQPRPAKDKFTVRRDLNGDQRYQ